jgi:hypothetical protein
VQVVARVSLPELAPHPPLLLRVLLELTPMLTRQDSRTRSSSAASTQRASTWAVWKCTWPPRSSNRYSE